MNSNNERKVSEAFVLQVLDKIKESNESLAADSKAISNAVVALTSAFKKRFDGEPKPSEIKNLIETHANTLSLRYNGYEERIKKIEKDSQDTCQMLKKHCEASDASFCSISDTLGAEDTFFDSIISELKLIKSRISLMIAVVAITFSLATVSYIFVKSTVDSVIQTKMETIEEQYQEDLKEDIDKIEKLVREHIKQGK